MAKAVLTATLCGAPAVAVMLAAGPATLVSEKAAGVETPDTVAFTVYVPAVLFAVNAGEVATPLVFVVAVAVAPPAKVPPAPLEGAVNVTVTPLSTFPPLSFTIACKTELKAAPTVAVWPLPLCVVTLAGGPTWLVKTKLAGPTPVAVAATL